ncbi:MAG TPA: saccharopine dehydrogenase NADP-binding domain-containing protein [Acidimicrobiales bacterium]|nr:saccharopine dehydrogenase NADP-binding domain-containing protein [Acidimicrobiales bacterium]
MTWMIYGAYGYTGALVAALASERHELPVLAGRDGTRLRELGEHLQLEHRTIDLADGAELRRALQGVDLVAHCAGPFSATARPMVDACVETGTHYLDITGEIDVFEAILPRDDEARDAGVVLLPGAGFDVVPTDCMAAMLAEALPGAERLELAFTLGGGPSPGTAKTAMEALGAAGRCRIAGVIRDVPADRRRRTVRFADGEAGVTAISWGDVATAYRSTGIGDIVVYAALPGMAGPMATLAEAVGPLVRGDAVQRLLKRVVGRLPGPTAAARAKGGAQIWGQVTGPDGRRVTGTMSTPNGYDLTADAVVTIAQRILAGGVAPGAHTPSSALGSEFVRQLEGVKVEIGG